MPSRAELPHPGGDLGVYGLPGDVTPREFRFDPTDRAFLDRLPDGRLRIRVWSEPELDEGALVIAGTEVQLLPMEAVARGDRIHWLVEAGLRVGDQFSFAFRTSRGDPVYLVPGGVTNAVERLDRWVVPEMEAAVPAAVAGAIIYQVFPDRFATSGPRTDPELTDPWGTPPHPRRFQGGDLDGITEKLPYLEDLGVELIYLNPIFTAPSNHRYDAVDYLQVDPSLGGNGALARLVAAAHDRGMRVILDASFNHCHPRFFAFADVVEKGAGSGYRDWFVVRDFPVRIQVRRPLPDGYEEWLDHWATQGGLEVEEVDHGPPINPTYDAWYGVPTMPRLDLSNPDARRYMLGVARHWVAEYRIDGWRMDVARYVDPDFWDDFRTVVKAVDPDAYLLAEIMGDASSWLQGNRFDATMNYPFRRIVVRFLAEGVITGVEAAERFTQLWAGYGWGPTLLNHNLIGSHDTPRFLTLAGGELWRSRLAMVMQMTFPGMPGVYYGDEVGMEGDDDPGSRGAFPWDSQPGAHPLARTIAELAVLRGKEPALRLGDWRPGWSSADVLSYHRVHQGRKVTVVINRGDDPATLELPAEHILGWGEAVIHRGGVTVPAREAAVLLVEGPR